MLAMTAFAGIVSAMARPGISEHAAVGRATHWTRAGTHWTWGGSGLRDSLVCGTAVARRPSAGRQNKERGRGARGPRPVGGWVCFSHRGEDSAQRHTVAQIGDYWGDIGPWFPKSRAKHIHGIGQRRIHRRAQGFQSSSSMYFGNKLFNVHHLTLSGRE